jgi:hypothetical protein
LASEEIGCPSAARHASSANSNMFGSRQRPLFKQDGRLKARFWCS